MRNLIAGHVFAKTSYKFLYVMSGVWCGRVVLCVYIYICVCVYVYVCVRGCVDAFLHFQLHRFKLNFNVIHVVNRAIGHLPHEFCLNLSSFLV